MLYIPRCSLQAFSYWDSPHLDQLSRMPRMVNHSSFSPSAHKPQIHSHRNSHRYYHHNADSHCDFLYHPYSGSLNHTERASPSICYFKRCLLSDRHRVSNMIIRNSSTVWAAPASAPSLGLSSSTSHRHPSSSTLHPTGSSSM